MKLPYWFRQRLPDSNVIEKTKFFEKIKLNTVCQSAQCPNINSCFRENTATFMILGNICTRDCRFCAVEKSKDQILQIDAFESKRVLEAIKVLNLDYVVITSVTRDDLHDVGAEQFKEIIKQIHLALPHVKIEILIPDFAGNYKLLKKIAEEKPDVISHNLETVSWLYPAIRPQADYQRSLKILKEIKNIDKKIITKSSLMLGLGEVEEEIIKTMQDLRSVDCDILTLGQYLAPSEKHFPVKRFILPEEFEFYKNKAQDLGFKAVASGPLVRSSYQAKEIFEEVKNLCNPILKSV